MSQCQRCGAAMVSRTNKHTGAAFSGCSRFPACRFAMSAREDESDDDPWPAENEVPCTCREKIDGWGPVTCQVHAPEQPERQETREEAADRWRDEAVRVGFLPWTR